ncbi:hypothetical protein [Nonomuraea sp. NPDC049400]|uniref:hypothetical protein n=1 Tax=Nonomuraea sp. NPDC049400 TaxID=3364352 RepID=UPI0037B8C616
MLVADPGPSADSSTSRLSVASPTRKRSPRVVQAPIADRFRAAIALANELVSGPGGGLEQRVRACQVVAGLADPVVLFRDEPAERLRSLILDGASALLGEPPAPRPRGAATAGGVPSSPGSRSTRHAPCTPKATPSRR